MNMAILIVSKAAGIGIGSVLTRYLSMFRTPIGRNILAGTCEFLGVFLFASMVGDRVEDYTKEQIEEIISNFNEIKEDIESKKEEHDG